MRIDDTTDSAAAVSMDVPNTGPNRIQKGRTVQREAYISPILESLYERGGRASGSDVLETVEQKTRHLFSEVDYEVVNGNVPRWRKGAQWTHQDLIKRGLLKRDSARGIWELTEQGIAEVEANKEK